MAEGDAGPTKALSNSFFTKKLGPLPMWLIILGGIALLYYYESRKKAGSSATATGANQQTDPAGNIGSIDPATGYVYGTPEDTAALASNNAGTGGAATGTTGTGAGGGASTYVDNNAWASAAINALVARGIDPTSANEAITEYLAGQALTSQQQADISMAIDSVGSPPTLPGPVGNPPVTQPGPPSTTLPAPPVTVNGTCSSGYTYSATQTGGQGEVPAAGGQGWCEPNAPSGGAGTVPVPVPVPAPAPTPAPVPVPAPKPGPAAPASWSFPAPTGLKASLISDSGYTISWNPVKGPQGQKPATYTVATYDASGSEVDQFDPVSTSTKEYGKGGTGLKKGTTYHTNVWANGGPKAPPHATVTVKTLS